MMDFSGAPRQREESAPKAYPVDPVENDLERHIRLSVQGRTGEVRIDCLNPNCQGGQGETLGVNTGTGVYNCFRCGIKGNYLKPGINEKKPLPVFLYESARPVKSHPYSVNKQFQHYDFREDAHRNLVFAYRDRSETITTVQFIAPTGKKKFLKKEKGGRFKGSAHIIPGNNKKVYACEGIATGATIHALTSGTVICCGAKDNLGPVLSWAVGRYSDSSIIICADNDKSGDGQRVAGEAAKKYQLRMVLPPTVGQDFNDLFIAEGPEAVKAALEETSRMDASTVIDNQKILQKAKEILNSQQPCGDFDITRLPKVLSEYVSALRQETAADPIVILQSVLCSISAIMRKNYCIPEGMYFQRLFANIWMLSIALSGSFKTTGMNKGAAACFGIKEDLQRQIRAIRGNNEDPSDEDLSRIIKLESQIPILPSRVTAEGLLELLAQDCGGMIMCSELGEWLENISKSFAGALKATLTDFYDVPPFYDYKTRTQRYLKVEQPFITINGVSTLDWIVRNLQPDDVTSGFFARFLILNPPSKRVIPSALPGVKHRSPVVNEFIEMMQGMASTLQQYHHPVEYSLPGETRQLFEAYHSGLYDALYNESDKAQEILGPYVKRWSPYLLKIAMILQFIEDPDSTVIRPQALEFSKGIVDYAVKSTTHLFQTELGETEHQRKCRKVIEYIARQGGKVSWGTLLRSKTLDGGSSEYEYACTTMTQSGTIIFDISSEQKKNHLLILNTEVEKVGKS